VAGTYTSEAQKLLLMTTATVLYRLKPHLSAVRQRKSPGRKKGQGAYDDGAAIGNMCRLVEEEGVNPWSAAGQSVELADQRNPDAVAITKRLDGKYRRLSKN
jgi:hypothetical protein